MKLTLLILSLVISFSTTAGAWADKISIQEDFQCVGKKNCKYLMRHLRRDSNSCIIEKKKVEDSDQFFTTLIPNLKNITGTIKYLGVYPARYAYQVIENSAGDLEIQTSVFFSNYKDFSVIELSQMESQFQKASQLWNKHNPFNFNLKFNFKIVYKKLGASVAVKLLREKTRGPYFKKWSLKWNEFTIAHEMGHIMGLDDEYNNNPLMKVGSTKCIQDSLMCRSSKNTSLPKDFHYYLILRRLQCS